MNFSVTYPTLETDRLILRGPKIEDFDAFAAFMASDRARFVGGPGLNRFLSWRSFGHLTGMWALRGYGTFVFTRKDTGEAIGHGGPWHPITHPEPELGYCLWSTTAEGQGYCTEAITAARRYAFGTLGWDTCVSYIDPDNHRSAAVATRLGAVIDPTAPVPEGEEDEPLHVYRHVKGAA